MRVPGKVQDRCCQGLIAHPLASHRLIVPGLIDVVTPWVTCSATPAAPTSAASHLRASHDDYQDSFLPTESMIGTAEDAVDTACGLYLNDPTAWT